MNLYEIISLENELERIASANNGEIPEEMFKILVEEQTKSIEKIEGLCKYIRHLEQFIENAQNEITRISKLEDRAWNRIESIKKYLTPYVLNRGKFDAGLFKISIKKSKSVELVPHFSDQLGNELKELYCTKETIYTPDKKKIKEALKKNILIPGAKIKDSDNLQIK